jgi:Resolvase, N terminal domain
VCSAPETSWCSYPAAYARSHIARCAAGRGWRIDCIFEDDPAKGRSIARTRLGDALERIESRQSDGLIVARLKHLDLSLAQTAAVLERISAAGGRFVSVFDGIDLGTQTGQAILRLLLSLPAADVPAAQEELSIHASRRIITCISATAHRAWAASPDSLFPQQSLPGY